MRFYIRPPTVDDSQFPFWDFVQCNEALGWESQGEFEENSQFPFWDFVQCNKTDGKPILLKLIKQNSQFPFWDFVECNKLEERPSEVG